MEAELAKQKKDCDDTIAKLRDQYEKNMKDALKKNEESIVKLQKPQEDFIKKISDNKVNSKGIAKIMILYLIIVHIKIIS